jgi:hypothetical protein
MARIPLSKLLEASLAGHSELYRWMLEHADDLERAISVAGRPNWPALARTFGEAGLTDRNGNPPNPEVARQTWFKVRKALAAQAALPSHRRAPIMRHAGGAGLAAPPTETTANDPEEPEFVTLTGKKIPTRKP